jgi:uncharacterized membrane protein
MRKFGLRLLNYFFNGLLIVVPLVLTAYVLYSSVSYVDHLGPFKEPGLGFLTLVSGITLLGFLARSFFFSAVVKEFDKLLKKAPLVKLIYSSIRDLLEAFVGEKRKFNEPVLVEMYAEKCFKIGFITRQSMEQIGFGKHVAVYFPQSYAFTGSVLLVPSEKVKILKISATEAMKFVVSGGVTGLEELLEDSSEPDKTHISSQDQ